MKLYTIGDLEHISGIKAHTIRMWENRYGLLNPERSEGNTRYYPEKEMRKLMMVALLNKSGLRISKIAGMNEAELQNSIRKTNETDNHFTRLIDLLLLHSVQFSETGLITLFNSMIDQYGIEVTFSKVVFPFLRKVGTLWLTGKITPGHEHFFSNLCRQKLFAEIDKLPAADLNLPHVVLFLPEWDFHELGILFYAFLLRRNLFSCTYLGQAVPVSDAIETIASTGATVAIASFISAATRAEIEAFVYPIVKKSPLTKFYLSGPQLTFSFDQYPDRITVFRSADELKKIFNIN